MKRLRLLPVTDFQGRLLLPLALILILSPIPAGRAETLTLRHGLAVAGGGRGGRSPVHTDAIEAEIISGKWQRPS